MQFWRNLNNKGRILLLLLTSLVLLNTIVLVTTHTLKRLSHSFTSMLNDRLVPSTDLALVQGYCYQNRLYLEDLVYHQKPERLLAEISRNNGLIDSTFLGYKKTYLTAEESEHADAFVKALERYRQHELRILSRLQVQLNRAPDAGQAAASGDEAVNLFYGESEAAFANMISELHQLSGIQLLVGKTLYEHTGSQLFLLRAVAYCSLCISLLVAVHLLRVLGIKPTVVFGK
ncbi:MCP four helix bundle domain-containing protein [Cesiribacter andamanensis]|uniref:Four helix bundle sensory module for signal transduction n=1 Tax=Cesiribacter andamanensis AMV16 TaxID=1279009 RepID=M7N4H4_9BACT|nr:MCP four helix bundle domain-containing protein [Cesiribacter andamanensis]EMR02197.1 Four helix bundle sensory module for signal transduction [Cesiribacter andamanensis AMV16]